MVRQIKKKSTDIFLYLLLILAFWAFTFVMLSFWLRPYSIRFEQTGTPNGSEWYMLPLGFLVMIPFAGIAEFPGGLAVNIYRAVILTCSILLWLYENRIEKQISNK